MSGGLPQAWEVALRVGSAASLKLGSGDRHAVAIAPAAWRGAARCGSGAIAWVAAAAGSAGQQRVRTRR